MVPSHLALPEDNEGVSLRKERKVPKRLDHRSSARRPRQVPREKKVPSDVLSIKLSKIVSYQEENFESHWGPFSFTDKIILDVGADYGSTAAFFLKRGAKRVVAVEPKPVYFKQLVSNFRLDSRVTPEQIEVRGPSDLEDLIRKFRPSLVKMDCEGCEAHLTGVDPAVLRRVPEYLVETHEHIGMMTRDKVAECFRKIGYLHESYEVLPGAWVTHAKRVWDRIDVSEEEILQLRNKAALENEQARRYVELNEAMHNDPLSALLRVYQLRPDLKESFPEVRDGDYARLLEWAKNIIDNRIDESRLLVRFKSWYESNPINQVPRLSAERDALSNKLEKTTVQVDELKTQLSEDDSELASQREQATSLANELTSERTHAANLEKELTSQREQATSLANELTSERTHAANLEKELTSQREQATSLANELESLRGELSAVRAERDSAINKLNRVQSEIAAIKTSIGFRLMRFYGSPIDRSFPDRTKRGDFKNIIKESVRLASTQGIRTLFRLASEKIGRREFRITPKIPQFSIEMTPAQRPIINIQDLPKSEPVQMENPLQPENVLVHVDYPQISAVKAEPVPAMFVLTGWALSETGIRQIDLYLDNRLIGQAVLGMNRPDIAAGYPNFRGSEKAGFRKIVAIPNDGAQNVHVLRIVARSLGESEASVEGLIEIERQLLVTGLTREDIRSAQETPVSPKASIVILTRSPPPDFEAMLQRLRSQTISTSLEILIFNSSGDDLSDLKRKYNVSIQSLSPEQFRHAATRNLAAGRAAGRYVFFLSDDAIPASPRLLADMIAVIERDPKLAAVSARQIPRSDADFAACRAIWEFYDTLGVDRDRIISVSSLDGLNSIQRRQVGQIDDVCSCFRKDIFQRYRYDENLFYAEDLDLGIRLVRDGYKIAQLSTTGVIHSHNRPASYYLRRGYVDFKTIAKILHFDLTETVRSLSGMSLENIIDQIMDSYERLSSAMDTIIDARFHEGALEKIFDGLESKLRQSPQSKHRSGNADLSRILSEITEVVDHGSWDREVRHNLLIGRYLTAIESMKQWLTITNTSVTTRETELAESLYKLLGQIMGTFLAEYYLCSGEVGKMEKRLESLDALLSRGV